MISLYITTTSVLYAGKQQKADVAHKSGELAEGYLLSAGTSKKVYLYGEPVLLNIILQNTSKQNRNFVIAYPLGIYDLEVIKPDSQKALVTPDGKKLLERSQRGMTMLAVWTAPLK